MVDKRRDNAASRAITPSAGSAVVPHVAVELLNLKAAKKTSRAPASSCAEEAVQDDDDDAASCSAHSSHTSVSAATTLRMRNAVVANVAVASVGKKTPSVASLVQEEDDEASAAEEEDGTTRVSKKTRTTLDARKALQLAVKEYEIGDHFKRYKASKATEAKIRTLRKWGRQCGRLTDSQSAENLSQECFDFADTIESRQDFFVRVKNDFMDVGVTLTDASKKIVEQLPMHVIASMSVQACTKMSQSAMTSDADAKLFYSIVIANSQDSIACNSIGLHMLANDQSSLSHHQRAVTLSHMENILKLNEVKDIVTSANLLTKPLHDVPINELAAFIRLAANSDGGAPVLGWMPAMLVDVASIYCMAKAGEAILERRKIHKTLHPVVAAVVDNVSKISARIRCYHKAISSNTANASKAIWDRLVEFTQSQVASVVCPVTAAQVDAWEEVLAKGLADMSTSTEFVLENAVVKILDDNCVELRGLALHAAQQPDGDGAIDGEEEALSKSTKALYTTLSKCLCELLRKHSYHADIISDHLQATVAVEANTIAVDAGEGEIAQKIHDDVFYTDVENHPEPLALLWMTCSLAQELSRFDGSHAKTVFSMLRARLAAFPVLGFPSH
jgi:hypothetical protein